MIYNQDLIVGTMRLGQWGAKLDKSEYLNFITACLDMGLEHFDHADIYGAYTTESEFGEVLKEFPELKKRLKITTKCGIRYACENRPSYKIKSYDASAHHIRESVENALSNLGIEQIHVLLIHRPDVLMDADEIALTFESLKKEGKVAHFGVSNFTPSQFDLIHSKFPLVTNQVEISINQLDSFTDGTLDQCQSLGIQPSAWSPLGGGAIFSENPDEKTDRIKKVAQELADKHNASISQILLAWLQKHPAGIIAVTGTSKVSRVKEALGASQIKLTREEWYELWTASTGSRVA